VSRLGLVFELSRRFMGDKKSSFLNLISSVSVIGVGIGVLALLVVTSVVNGFQNELMRTIAGTQGDVIFYSHTTPIRNPEILEEKIKSYVPDLIAISQSFVSEVMMTGPNGSEGSVLEGVDLQTWPKVVDVSSKLIEGQMPSSPNEILLGKTLAEHLGVKTGDPLQVVSPFSGGDDSSAFGTPRSQAFMVSGIIHFGMHDYDSKYAYTSLLTLQTFLEQPKQITNFRLKLAHPATAKIVAQELSENFGFPYLVKDWSRLNKNLLYAITVEKTVITILMTAILIVAAFNVVSALFMMVFEKEAEISILRVIGMRQRDHFLMFSFIGSAIGLVGTIVGLVGGAIVTLFLRYSHFVSLPADVYRLEYLPVVVRFSEWGAIALLSFVICLLATVGPAMRVARRVPVEGLKWSQ